MAFSPSFKEHLVSGATHVARAWEVRRSDGVRLGFTDHDRDLRLDGLTFCADGGLTARAFATSTGLAVDNSEAIGALRGDGIRDDDISAGRFDGAQVKSWLVNWSNTEDRALQFQGSIGEITKTGGEFRAELRGLSEALNVPRGRVYQAACSAVLGNGDCGFDLSTPGFSIETEIVEVRDRRVMTFADLSPFAQSWFERGTLEVLDGAANGLSRVIKEDRTVDGLREIQLWESLMADVAAGDQVRLIAGCDKRAETCKAKFSNFLNFRGFPHIPGEDWLASYPRNGDVNDGGSLG